LKYLEAENDCSQTFEQGVVYVDNIEALKMKINRLEVFKPTSSNLVLSVEQIQTNDVTRAKTLVANRDISVLRVFKEEFAESTKILPRLLSILIYIFPRPSIRMYTFLLLLLFITSILFWHELNQVERDRQEEQRLKDEDEKQKIAEEKEIAEKQRIKEEKEMEEIAERDRQEKQRIQEELEKEEIAERDHQEEQRIKEEQGKEEIAERDRQEKQRINEAKEKEEIAERDRQEKQRIKEELEKEEIAERDRQEEQRLSVEAVAQVRCSPVIQSTVCLYI
jgi:hypothetical protein